MSRTHGAHAQPDTSALTPEQSRRPVMIVAAVMMVVAVLGSALGTVSATSDRQAAQAAAADELSQVNAQVALLRDELDATTVQRGLLDSLGLDRQRVAADTALIERVLSTAFTFDDGESLASAREEVSKLTGQGPLSPLLREVLVPATASIDASGERHYWVDAVGLNASLSRDDVRVDVTGLGPQGQYLYVVTATVRFTSDYSAVSAGTGARQARHDVLVRFSVNRDGEVTSATGVGPGSATLSTAG